MPRPPKKPFDSFFSNLFTHEQMVAAGIAPKRVYFLRRSDKVRPSVEELIKLKFHPTEMPEVPQKIKDKKQKPEKPVLLPRVTILDAHIGKVKVRHKNKAAVFYVLHPKAPHQEIRREIAEFTIEHLSGRYMSGRDMVLARKADARLRHILGADYPLMFKLMLAATEEEAHELSRSYQEGRGADHNKDSENKPLSKESGTVAGDNQGPDTVSESPGPPGTKVGVGEESL